MMLSTHALAGMALAVLLARAAPEAAGVVVLAGLVGGVVPDLDLYVGHRRTLHFPVYYSAAAAVAVPVAFLLGAPVVVAVAAGLVGAAAHCVADVFGGGLELRPWDATENRAVYDHHRGRWIAPRRWVRYDGAPEDALVAALLAAGLWGAVTGSLRSVVAALFAVSLVYAVVRRTLPDVVEVVVPHLPDSVADRLPARYRQDVGEASDAAASVASGLTESAAPPASDR